MLSWRPALRTSRETVQRLRRIAADLAGRTALVRSPYAAGKVSALLHTPSDDERAIRHVLRRFKRLSRGPIHPANWSRLVSWLRG